jgi:hypothetical protein
MTTLNDSPDLLRQTTAQLTEATAPLTAQSGLALIDQWIEPLLTTEQTKPVAEKLTQLKTLLEAEELNPVAVRSRLVELAKLTVMVESATNADEQTASLLDDLIIALKQAAGTDEVI